MEFSLVFFFSFCVGINATLREEQKLRVIENRTLRKAFGAKRSDSRRLEKAT
jgi:hypothetical protein